MNYAIVENEYHSLVHIKEMLAALRPDWNLAFTAETVRETVDSINKLGVPDLMFLDIDLNDGNSFRLFDEVSDTFPVIFTTAYDEFCLKAFKVHSIDYLLKPITIEDMLFAIRKFENMQTPPRIEPEILKGIQAEVDHTSDKSLRVLIPSKDGYRFVNTDEIAWIESDTKCVVIVDRGGGTHITTFSSLSDIEDLLPRQSFYRVSRAVIASITSIEEVKKTFNYKLKLRLRAGSMEQSVEVASSKKKEFLNWLGCNKT